MTRTSRVENDSRWQALVSREAKADGKFVYAVKSTGVYCRPSCAARLPKPENVTFFDTCGDAEEAGFRACKRCQPNAENGTVTHTRKIAEICKWMENTEERVVLNDLADRAGMSPYHFHRLFKAATGLTPHAYAATCRDARARRGLQDSGSVTEAIYNAGYGSNGRFYARADQALGMKPSNYRAGGANEAIRFAVGECSLGSVLVARSERGICAISLGDDPDALVRDLQDRFPRAELVGGDHAFEKLVATVVALVEAPGVGCDLPLDIRGTAFQKRVWQALRDIPAGAKATYAEIAERIGSPRAVRAVGQACGANSLALAIPCHRVVRNDGGLSGYRWGVERKRSLLERESRT